MDERIVCTRTYKDGDADLSFSLTVPVENEGHSLSFVLISKNGVITNRYKIVGIDPMHALALSVIDCARHITDANQNSKEGLLFLGDRDLGLPDKILTIIEG